jgi:hypothetical protein
MKVIRAVGDYAVIELVRDSTKSGILTRLENTGRVVSCKVDDKLEGKTVMFDTNGRLVEYGDYIFVPHDKILCVVKDE